MTDYHSMTLDKSYSEVTRQELIDNPYIRPFYLEWMLSYFFGETKFLLTGENYTIQLLETGGHSTTFNNEILSITYEEFIDRFWKLVFNIECYAHKKSRLKPT